MSELTRQQLCAALNISESTVYRAEREGMPCTPIGKRTKRYDLDECKRWFRSRGAIERTPSLSSHASYTAAGNAFIEFSRRVRLRVRPGARKG